MGTDKILRLFVTIKNADSEIAYNGSRSYYRILRIRSLSYSTSICYRREVYCTRPAYSVTRIKHSYTECTI
jgi:hypothetical protein